MRLPDVRFDRGICLRRAIPVDNQIRENDNFMVIGEVIGKAPFLLSYMGIGVTSWWCNEQLGDSLRKKILGQFRDEVRYKDPLPEFIGQHDLREQDQADLRSSGDRAAEICERFIKVDWLENTLGEREEDWVTLQVPYVQKDAAKALGARWNAQEKVWQAKASDDMSAFEQWLPQPARDVQRG